MMDSNAVKAANVAGRFYPADPDRIRRDWRGLLESGEKGERFQMLLVPHAGWMYSGGVAAEGYRLLRDFPPEGIVLAGPSHHFPLRGIAIPAFSAFETPLGLLKADETKKKRALINPAARETRAEFDREHCLEVQFPVLQILFPDKPVLPVLVGKCDPGEVADFFESVLSEHDLLIISSDLSHFHAYEQAKRLDEETIRRILQRETVLSGENACGASPLNGALHLARRKGWRGRLLSYRNSGDTGGDRERVVGYACVGFSGGEGRV